MPLSRPITLRIPQMLNDRLSHIPSGRLTAWIIEAIIQRLDREKKERA